MMKNLLFIIILVILSSPVSFAQQNHINPSTKAFNLKWEIIENNHSNKLQSLSALTLLTSDELIPAYGWKLYFNLAEQILPDSTTGNLKITPINGDLFCLSPTENFKGIKANDSLRITLVSTGWLTNITDAPHGFYLIWDNAPQQYYNVNISVKPTSGPKQYMRSPQDKVGLSTPELVYEQNKNIRNIPADSLVKIFPTPDSSQVTSDKFILDASVAIYADPAFKPEAANLKTELLKLLIPVPDRVKAQKKYIKLIKKPMAPEAYELVINSNSISIASSSGAGIFYGMQSLKTLLPAQAWHHPQKTIIIPGLKVKDKPRFAYRALMLDVARNFQPKMEIIKLLDVMALYKLNVLHFHLCDDEGWRLEIPALPELTVVGSTRGHTLTNKQYLQPTVGSGPFVHTLPGSGYYSRADFINLLRYANKKHITVIPEIESPGHARAAIKAMDARYDYFYQKGEKEQARQYLLHDLQDTSKYTSVQHYNDNVIDVSLPSTYNFIETVTGEIEKMYQEAGAPLKTIHYGGDEVPAGVWERSPSFLSLMKTDTAIKSTDDLWGYYYNHVNNILQKHNLYLTGWEEVGFKKVLENGKKVNVINPDLATKNIHLEVWNNVLGWGAEDLAYKLANRGYPVILSCVTNLYFDMAYNKAFNEPGYYWGGYADVDRSFSFIPYDYFKNTDKDRMGETLKPAAFLNKEKLTPDGKANIIGLQGALWGETLISTDRMEYMLLPKLLGLAERAWAKDPEWATEKDTVKNKTLYTEAWCQFVNVLGKTELPRLDYYANGFKYRIPDAGAVSINGQVFANVQMPGFTIHYTTNNQTPSLNSPVYQSPINTKGLIKLAVFNNAGRAGKTVSIQNN